MKQNQKKYKIIAILRPTLSSDKAAQLLQSMTVLQAGEQVEMQTMNMQVLAYPIDRNKQGHLSITELRATVDTIKSIRRKMEIDENILRVMVIKNDHSEKNDNVHTNFQIKDEFVKSMLSYTTKRGKITFGKVLPRKDRSQIAQSIKRLRYLALLPYCNYDI